MGTYQAHPWYTILDALAKIGETIPGLVIYHSFIDKLPTLGAHVVLEKMIDDILEFYQEALVFLDRTKRQKVRDLFWKTFHSQFDSILNRMKRRAELLESLKTLATAKALMEMGEK
ncbi:unnamed protein product [Parascedosporium putredinis]|uniref:Uncharacterized protein n=1 Tax=Parascedosporium putredinis TaxID=1442378 RepID=A0A9P1HBC7_9PEZI|nr:unnamed protein product [Parascedosporium putredinis]CAI8003830.1 unnamed protein product [Parascedosporium putredinis]